MTLQGLCLIAGWEKKKNMSWWIDEWRDWVMDGAADSGLKVSIGISPINIFCSHVGMTVSNELCSRSSRVNTQIILPLTLSCLYSCPCLGLFLGLAPYLSPGPGRDPCADSCPAPGCCCGFFCGCGLFGGRGCCSCCGTVCGENETWKKIKLLLEYWNNIGWKDFPSLTTLDSGLDFDKDILKCFWVEYSVSGVYVCFEPKAEIYEHLNYFFLHNLFCSYNIQTS